MKKRNHRISIVMNLPAWLFILGVSLLAMNSCSTENTPVYTLTTNVSPVEAGSVSPDQGEYDKGTEVQVSASANEHWVFTDWGGDYSGSTNPATIMMDDDKSLSALFEKKEYTLTVNIEGEGTVEERLVNAKSTDYPAESVVELTAVPAGGWEFTGWDESLSGQENPETVTINSPVSVTAMFEKVVNVTVEGEGDVQVEYIDEETGKRKSASRRVRLTATPQDGWKFVSWEGDLTGSENPIETTFDEEMTVDAVFVSEDGKWIVENSFTNKNITSIFFLNEHEGWATTIPDEFAFIGGSIYHTKDGGETWTEQLRGDPYKEFFWDIEFIDENNGWATMQSYHYGLLDPEAIWKWYGAIYHTSNGGQTWEVQYFLDGGVITDLEIVDQNRIFVVASDDGQSDENNDGYLIHSNNGGDTWSTTRLGEDWYSYIKFAGSSHGWIAGFSTAYKTTNGGNSWGSTSQSYNSMDFVDSMIGFGVKGKAVYRTTNQGGSWNQKRSVSGNIRGSDFVNSELGWVITENGDILQTTDGAQSWKSQKVYDNGTEIDLSSNKVYNIHFINSQSGWAGGQGGYLLRYEPSGE
ncbi:MAG: hypothetical protein GVY07_13415 [Bacteroidetes bacterium]|jgi:photosystem II stability/assembly factor-like uncharacterized protein|nr:hypothetical protein [Bacteroidota bacterium]